ncbi:MAG TPA: hypothetical protein VGH98_12195 [Gemmatimonadaceae bacterium]
MSDCVDHFATVQDTWSSVLASPELRAVACALEAAAIDVGECVREAATISELPPTRRRLEAIQKVVHAATDVAPGAFERFVLGHAVLSYRDKLRSSLVSPTVKRITCEGLVRFANSRTVLNVADSRFVSLCKMATLRRFAAGQFDWERSGFPRSWFHRVRPLPALGRLLSVVAFQWRGLGPAFFVHMPVTHPVHALFEGEALKSYYRMARSMELQPEVKGLIASAWLHSPATFEVSPHLAWLNKVFADHGAVMATTGRAAPDSGVFTRSVERQRAFDEGRFKPTIGLVVWKRRDMLAWAAAHPELDR